MDRMGAGSGSPWVPVLVVAGVAALAAWRIARTRRNA
jgi:MYXO-CTERM domain-containing protein